MLAAVQTTYNAGPRQKSYAGCLSASKRIRWDIDRDVIRGRYFDLKKKFLPDGLSKIGSLDFLTEDERRYVSQIQGRSYANMFGLVERFIGAKMLEVSRDHWLGNQLALEALVKFTDEELKHQELFRRIDSMLAEIMPAGYRFLPEANEVANLVLGKSTWAVLALTCHIELFTQAHYRESIAPDPELSELWRDVFFRHWQEESQHAILDELEWIREDAKLSQLQRDRAVGDLIELVGAVDGLLQLQAPADTAYFVNTCGRELSPAETRDLHDTLLRAYRWQYIVSGVQDERFGKILAGMINHKQAQRIEKALQPIINF
jgi:hypothetical protein